MTDFNSWLDNMTDHVRAKQEAQPAPVKCDTCEDTGTHKDMRCYGGPPIEVTVYCIDCGGSLAGELAGGGE